MPLLGHAFTGMATAVILSGRTPKEQEENPSSAVMPFLTTSLVILSYLPDITSQLSYYLQWEDGRIFGHSFLFSLLIGPAAGTLLRRQTGISLQSSIIIATTTVAFHDFLDILQSTDRQPFWPFNTAVAGSHISIIPMDPAKEALLFGSFYLLVLTVFLSFRNRSPGAFALWSTRNSWQTWCERIVIGTILVTAVTCHHLRTLRNRDFLQVMPYLQQHDYQGMLTVLNKVDRWPGIGKPGRISYFRGLAYMKLGDTTTAERYLLLAHRQDPMFFWSVADLTLIYASSNRPARIKETLTAPLLKELHNIFSAHPALPRYLEKIQQSLASTCRDNPSAIPADQTSDRKNPD